MLLRERRIIVTGGASGIAAATVRAYAREGARVASLDVNDEGGRRVAAEAGPNVAYYHCDVSRRAEVDDVFARAVAAMGGLDVLANVAGVERGTPAEDIPDAEWDLVMSEQERAIHDLAMQHVIPLGGRLGDPERDIAPVMVFLAGDGARFITGQVFAIDGGMIMLG